MSDNPILDASGMVDDGRAKESPEFIKKNAATLITAILRDDAGVVSCRNGKGETVYVLGAFNKSKDATSLTFDFVPLARMFATAEELDDLTPPKFDAVRVPQKRPRGQDFSATLSNDSEDGHMQKWQRLAIEAEKRRTENGL